ncbi:MAG: hypothetical protein ABIJ95_11215 [Pseudomonadota bacterium]
MEKDDSRELECALDRVRGFVAEITGEAPTDAELARALSRYFVLKEIMEHVELGRREEEEQEPDPAVEPPLPPTRRTS